MPQLHDSETCLAWCRRMQACTDYLNIQHMQSGMAYAIWARNDYVGIWLPEKQPYLFVEYHWDLGEPYGTAKPLRPLEICPLPLPTESSPSIMAMSRMRSCAPD